MDKEIRDIIDDPVEHEKAEKQRAIYGKKVVEPKKKTDWTSVMFTFILFFGIILGSFITSYNQQQEEGLTISLEDGKAICSNLIKFDILVETGVLEEIEISNIGASYSPAGLRCEILDSQSNERRDK